MQAYVTADYSSEGIATIAFFHPAQNSIPSAFLKRLAITISEAGEEERTKVIITLALQLVGNTINRNIHEPIAKFKA